MRLLSLALACAALPPLALAKIWKEGWEVKGSVCQSSIPASCSALCSDWTQLSDNQCVAGVAGSYLNGTWSTLDVLDDNSANFTLYTDAACSQPVSSCNFIGSLDSTCTYVPMCAATLYSGNARQTQYNYRFKLNKTLPAYIVVLIIVFGGVVPLLMILFACYCCCCRGSAKTRDAAIEAQRGHVYDTSAEGGGQRHLYTREQLRELEYKQRHPQQLTLEQLREREFAEKQRQKKMAAHGPAHGHASGHNPHAQAQHY